MSNKIMMTSMVYCMEQRNLRRLRVHGSIQMFLVCVDLYFDSVICENKMKQLGP